MSTRLLLVRHGAHDLLGRVLCGRTDAVGLNALGRAEAATLAEGLSRWAAGGRPDAVLCSPQLRARQTAAPMGARCGLTVGIEPALDEIDMGAWTGRDFAGLADDPAWQRWNVARGQHRPPGGESMVQVQVRLADWLGRLPAGVVVAVSHADVIKAAVCHALGLGLDQHARFDIDPAGVTTLMVDEWGVRLVGLNERLGGVDQAPGVDQA